MKHLYSLIALCVVAMGVNAQMVSVTWNLNMTNETVAAEGPSVAGGADFGFPGDNPMSDPDGDGIWTLTTEVASGYTGYYTFTNGACSDWSCKENIAGQDCANPANYNDRQLENITEDTVINTCFGQCSTDGSCEASSAVDVTFQVDMNNENTDGGVFMFGGFNGWNAGGNPMDDSDGDGIYTLTVNAQPGGFEWKYISGDGEETFDPAVSGECTLTSGEFTNRFILVEGSDNITLDVVCFNSCDACNTAPCVDPALIDTTAICPAIFAPVCGCNGVTYSNDCEAQNYGGVTSWTEGECSSASMVTFQVDMSNEDILGPIYVTGSSVDGWCGTCVEMTDSDADGIYEATVELETGDHEYKYNNGGWDGTESLDTDEDAACTLTTTDAGGTFVNRLLTLAPGAGDVTIDAVCFNSCEECETVEQPNTPVTFNVDMSEQTVSGAVYISGETIDGWAGSQVELTDADGDNVYSVTIELGQGAHEYKYMIGSWDTSENLEAEGDSACTLTTGGFTNRYLLIESEEAVDLATVCYESCDACAPVNAVAEQEGLSFRVFPSITDGTVTVAFPAPLADAAQIEVRDMSGRLVQNNNLGEGMTQIQVDLNNQTDGFYVIRVTSGLQVATEVVVKQH
jgi:hypothetical protein